MSLIAADSLYFTYPDKRFGLHDISFEIDEGSFVTLCGASGCGKSTLLRLMKPGLFPRGTASGRLTFSGERTDALDMARAAREIGFVMQDPEAQIVTDKVWHELAFSLESAGLSTAEIRRRVGEMAGYFGLEELFERDCAQLSGGEKQLLNLASAAAMHPRLLLLDEPTSQLDPIAAHSFIDTVSRLNRDFGITVMIAEHRLEELLHISDRVIVMDSGRIAADCAPADIADRLPSEHPMIGAMPVSVRFYVKGGGSGRAPLSVREGRANDVCRGAVTSLKPCEQRCYDGDPLIRAKSLWVSYDRNAADVLRSTDITIRRGGVYAILGGNGSGKTTLLKCLAGLQKPLGGSIRREKGVKCGYLPQNPCELFSADTVREELSRSSQEYEAAAERFALSELYDSHPYDLSGGEQQRLALAKLLLKECDILLLDEPTKGMDSSAKRALCARLRKLSSEGAAVVIVTHDTEFAADCADICGLLFDGEISGEAPPVEFFSDNYFYTTPARRLSRGIAEDIISVE